jgi:hypothetical protein
MKYHKTGMAITHKEAKTINRGCLLATLYPKKDATNPKITKPINVPMIDSALKPVGSVIRA